MTDVRETVQAIYAAFGRGDVPTLLGYLDEHIAWESWDDNTAVKAGVPWMQPRHGRAGAAEFFALLGTALRVRDFRIVSMMVGDGSAAVEFEIDVECPDLAVSYRDQEVHLWTFNEAGKATRLRHYLDTAKHVAVFEGRSQSPR